MSGAIEAVTGFDVGSIIDFAPDIGSITDLGGTEFLSSFDITSFEIPSFDVASLGGFDIAGSFAGSASWFDSFNPGSILDSIPSVSDFSLPSLTSSIPSLADIKKAATSVQSVVGTAQSAVAAYQKVAPTVNAAAGALGIQNPLTAIVAPISQAVGIAGAASGIAASGVNTAQNLVNTASRVTSADSLGNSFRELNAAETAELTRNVNPAFINSLVDPGTPRELINPVTGEITFVNEPVNLSNQTSQYATTYNPETGQWDVFDNLTSTTVRSGLTEQEAILAEQDLNITSGITLTTSSDAEDPFEAARLAALAESDTPVNLSGFDIGTNARALVDQARQQQTVRDLRQNKAQSSDWRVRLRLAPNSQYLYNAPGNPGDPASGPGIMAPLKVTDGVIFPYTPNIDTAYKANYDAYDLTHSNYRGYFYKGSHVDAINLRAQFTAQDTEEANYLLAVIHFFRSATKMFYGQDSQRGSPPPLVFLNGYGDYQFNEHPCAISQFNYQLPADVDYIRAQSALDVGTNMLGNRIRNPIANNPLSYTVNRLLNSGLLPGALDFRPSIANNLPTGSPTYVPTKMEISITLLPIQSRQQVSKNFSVKSFANGNLLRNGFW